MLDLMKVIKSSEFELKNYNENNFENILNVIFKYIEDTRRNNPEVEANKIIPNLLSEIKDRLNNMGGSIIIFATVEYYLNLELNSSSEYNLDRTYNRIIEKEKKGEIDLLNLDTSQIKYGNNMQENMEKVVSVELHKLRCKKQFVKNIMENDQENREIIELLLKMNAKGRKNVYKKIPKDSQEMIKTVINSLTRNEKELLHEEMKKRTENVLPSLKKECTQKITECVGFLDKLGLLDIYKDVNNRIYKNNLWLPNFKITYNETKELLSEENLKNASMEQLIAMVSFWTNRVNKVYQELNKCIYIIDHPELYRYSEDEKGNYTIEINRRDLHSVTLKDKVLHKLYVDLFDKCENGSVTDPKKEIEKIRKTYETEYKNYFDKILPDTDNTLLSDINSNNYLIENTMYNAYKIKEANIQALLITLINSNLSKIENYGYIQDDQVPISKKKFVLIGIDVPGMNMPLRLHVGKEQLINVLKDANKSTEFRLYKSNEDFMLDEDKSISTMLYVPMSKSKQEELEQNIKNTKLSGTMVQNTLNHLLYLSCKKKMPQHMKGEDEFIDINAKMKDEHDLADDHGAR